jgi:integrase/recombinase XerD
MFEQLFQKAFTITRHKTAPYAPERERYLEHCAKQGYASSLLRQLSGMLLRIAHELRDCPDLKVTEEQIQAATQRATRRSRGFPKIRKVRAFRKTFEREMKRWLRFLGRFRESGAKPSPFAALLDDFASWMEHERGLSPATIKNRCWHIAVFLRWFGEQERSISSVRLADVDAFQAACKTKGLSRIAIKIHTNGIRAFLRYAASRGWCSSSIAEGIQGPRIYAQEDLPGGPSWEEIKRLVASFDTDRPADIRGRAAVMLFAIYGLRASEVSRLRLEDIDWEHDQVVVRRYKQRYSQPYPLVPAVGNAIARYLKEVRPKCTHRELFITLLAPRRPMSCGSLYSVVARKLQRLEIKSLPHRGPHALRHACAVHLLSEGLTLKEIGDHLGHRSPSATRIYAKVDLAGLREVAAFDLGGVL